MPKPIISDASCFIILDNIGQLDLLQKTYESIFTTSFVAAEFGLPLPSWVEIRDATDTKKVRELMNAIGRGEASAIGLALEMHEATLIIDDQKARKIAERMGLNATGTVGAIVRAKLQGVIPSIRPAIAAMRQTNFRLSDEVVREALREAGESQQ